MEWRWQRELRSGKLFSLISHIWEVDMGERSQQNYKCVTDKMTVSLRMSSILKIASRSSAPGRFVSLREVAINGLLGESFSVVMRHMSFLRVS